MTSEEALSTVGVGESSSSVETSVSWPESPPPPVPEVLTEGRREAPVSCYVLNKISILERLRIYLVNCLTGIWIVWNYGYDK